MRSTRHPLAALLITCCVLAACSSDTKPAAIGSNSNVAPTTPASAGADATPPAAATGDVDCEALKLSLADLLVNWQIVIGLANSPTTEWSTIPIGHITELSAELTTITVALGSDADAGAALSFMAGANDIVIRGLGGDATAQADLGAYMGTDIGASVAKQLPISLAYEKAGCN